MTSISEQSFYYDSIRITMGGGGRFIVRLIIYVFYGALASASVVLVFADFRWMTSLGVFIILFLIDCLFHINHAEEPLSRMPREGVINLATYTSPSVMNILERALEKSYFIGGDVLAWVALQCLSFQEVQYFARKNNMNIAILRAQLRRKLDAHSSLNIVHITHLYSSLLEESLQKALADGSDFIMPHHLFSAVTEDSLIKMK